MNEHLEDSLPYWSPEQQAAYGHGSPAPETAPQKKHKKTLGSKIVDFLRRSPEARQTPDFIQSVGESQSTVKGEDATLRMDYQAVFGVFDGAGGNAGGERASVAAAGAVQRYAEAYPDEMNKTGALKAALEYANQSVIGDPEAGYTTASICKVFQKPDGALRLAWASIGDSRIYVVRDRRAYQLTKDEGLGNIVTNAIGHPKSSAQQAGRQEIRPGDRIVLVTDGVTGDKGEWSEGGQLMPPGVLAGIVSSAASSSEAADQLIRSARKNDDRTAIVVEV